jgi:predicted TPR repeat methyltransferase
LSSDWDEHAGNWDTDADVVLYSEKAFQSLCRLVSLDGLWVMDFGCGTGLLTEKISSLAEMIVGLDTSRKMLSVLSGKGLPNVVVFEEELSRKLIEDHAILQSGFDLIVASSVCSFLSDFEGTLSLLKSLLVPRGLFVQWDWWTGNAESEHGFTKEQVEDVYRRVGLESVSVTPSFSLKIAESDMGVLMGVARIA